MTKTHPATTPTPPAAPLPDARRRRLLGLAPAATLAAGTLLAGCAGTVDVARYVGERPQLDLRRYFDGTVDAWGLVTDRSGAVLRRFTVVMRCSWDGDVGTLDEDFVYSDGSKEKRIWTIRRLPDGRYTGTAADVVGTAEGRAAGNALSWRYTLRLPLDGRTVDVELDDWMFQMDERVLLNRAVIRKFGIRFAEVTLAFVKRP